MFSKQGALWKVAMECSLLRMKKKCNNNFNDANCSKCKYNIYQYIDADPRHAALFMLEAEDQAADLIEANKRADSYIRTLILLIVGFILFGYFILSYKPDTYSQPIHVPMFHQIPEQPVRVQPKVSSSTAEQNIDITLNRVARDLRNRVDVNADGLVNCIDAAVLFYKYYPVRNEVTITLNYNEATGMNHLFNVVKINENWRAIEPQAKYVNNNSYWMRDVWGATYDSSKNTNATRDYIKYVR